MGRTKILASETYLLISVSLRSNPDVQLFTVNPRIVRLKFFFLPCFPLWKPSGAQCVLHNLATSFTNFTFCFGRGFPTTPRATPFLPSSSHFPDCPIFGPLFMVILCFSLSTYILEDSSSQLKFLGLFHFEHPSLNRKLGGTSLILNRQS